MNVKKPRQPVRSGALTIVITCVLILLAVLGIAFWYGIGMSM